MTRAEAAAYLEEQYTGLREAAGIPDGADDATGWKQAIDAALRAQEVAEADLPTAVVATADVPDFLLLLRYWGASRLLDVLAAKYDVTLSSGLSPKRSQVYAMVERLLARAKAACDAAGVDPQASAGTVGTEMYTGSLMAEVEA